MFPSLSQKNGYLQTPKQSYRKLKYKEKVFGEFQGLPRFPRKMVLYLLRKFFIFKPRTEIHLFRKFDLHFWKDWKQIYLKLQYKEFFFGKFQGQPRFPRKVVLCSLTKFGILKPCTNIQSLKRFDVGC